MNELDKKINEYVDKFDTNIPIFHFTGKTDDEIITILDECIASGKPIDTSYMDNAFQNGIYY